MTKHKRIALFPGTFDPMSNGHLDVIRRGQNIFDELVIAIAHNSSKKELFSMEERLEMVTELVGECCTNARVEAYEGLTVDYAKRLGATVILRGLRNVTDLHYEFQLALTNRAIADIETVFIMTGDTHVFTSSSLIKQVAAGGGVHRLHKLIPELVLNKLKEKIKHNADALLRLREDGLKD